jgi:penicillin-insensitive murein endopeptidase
MKLCRAAATAALLAALAGGAAADPVARGVFGALAVPSDDPAAAIGAHARGCLAGGVALDPGGPDWQVMRPSRNRNWGHPEAIAFVERLGRAARAIGWPGLHVGDISQPRGGPMRSGHRSHQTGLDLDIWFRRPPERRLTRAERDSLSAVSMVAPGGREVTARWSAGHEALLRAAATDPAVARIFVHPAIKSRLCRTVAGERGWLRRIRPWWGHDAHFHVRLACPAGAAGCEGQDPPPPGEGCDETLAWWFSEEARSPAPSAEPRGPLRLSELPEACARVAGR